MSPSRRLLSSDRTSPCWPTVGPCPVFISTKIHERPSLNPETIGGCIFNLSTSFVRGSGVWLSGSRLALLTPAPEPLPCPLRIVPAPEKVGLTPYPPPRFEVPQARAVWKRQAQICGPLAGLQRRTHSFFQSVSPDISSHLTQPFGPCASTARFRWPVQPGGHAISSRILHPVGCRAAPDRMSPVLGLRSHLRSIQGDIPR